MRIEKYLSSIINKSRSEIKKDIKDGKISVNGTLIFKSINVDIEKEKVFYDGKIVEFQEHRYFLLNKPAGYICANYDPKHKTIFDLIDLNPNKYFSVGRLDKDTEGLLIITNDGEFSNSVLKPSKHVAKKYYIEVDKNIDFDIEKYNLPINIGDFVVKKYLFEYIGENKCFLTIYEGKFHQVKRMMKHFNLNVIYLKRIEFGNLLLPENLKIGEWKEINKNDIKKI
ncbi:16S rRNA pseudouridylate synthase [Mycoplasmopsis bovigenitalium]|uniref:pseudouridine synthase n=1 Tax=Mycoplasmopsis bovigenitalium TaxID=2112 RepID=UPI00090A41DB|nr:pseudouridine synthase [Mycoplasmopsis bovigenitalium]BAW18452.1 16S rRNA pseudouridylate synthase [Mycoplasmopsis bovigenitalium]